MQPILPAGTTGEPGRVGKEETEQRQAQQIIA